MTASPRRAGRPPKEPDRALARDALLDAAHALMAQRASIDVTVLEIAQRAKLNVALINYYFGGKDGLLLELALRHQAGFADAIRHLAASPLGAETKLTMHIRGMVRSFRRVPYLQRLHHKILRDSNEETARTYGSALVRPIADFYRELIDQGVAEGVFRRVEPMHLYLTLGGACDFLFSAGASLKYGFAVEAIDDEMAERYVAHLQMVLTRGLLAKAIP